MSAHEAGFETDSSALDEVFEGPSDVDAIDSRITGKRKHKNLRQVKMKMDLSIRLALKLMLALMTFSLDISAAILPLVLMRMLVSQVKTRLSGPLSVDTFIDSQFQSALRGEEEIFSSSHGETVTAERKMVVQVRDGRLTAANTLENFTFGSDTQDNLDHTISLSPNEELNSSGLIRCSCRENTDQEDLESCCEFNSKTTGTHEAERTKECAGGIELKETLTVPRNAVVTELQLANISDDVGTCWRELGPKLKIASSKVHNLDEDYRNNRDKANNLLIMWKHQEGSKATVGHLADVLESIGRKSVAEKLLGPNKGIMPTVFEGDCEVITLTVNCNLDAELNKLAFCEDAHGNKFILKRVNISKGHWNSREIQKNKLFLETVATAAQDMEKTTEQRRQGSLKRVSSKVQELRQQLEQVNSDLETCEENKQPTMELLNDTKMPLQDAAHLLHSCKEQHTFCQEIYNVLIKLIGDVGQPREDIDFMCIKQLSDFTRELKEQEKKFFHKIDRLHNLKQHLDELQEAQVEELEKWSRAQKEQVEGVEKLLSSLLNQVKIEKNQKLFKRRSYPGMGVKPSYGSVRRRDKRVAYKRSRKSQSLSEFPPLNKKSNISAPLQVQRVSVLDTDKEIKEKEDTTEQEQQRYTTTRPPCFKIKQ